MTSTAVELIPYNEILLQKKIGVGYFGRVYEAQWRGQTIAVKSIMFGLADKHIEREVSQLSKVEHTSIVKLYGISKHDDMIHLLEEYADGGSLSTLIHSNYPSYTMGHAINWGLQIAQGLAYLHGMKPNAIIHRDIKPLNAVLSKRGLTLKICDFGTVVDLATSMSVEVGTCRYKAPEVLKGRHYNEKCDVHSWAITLWEILSRKDPFEGCKTVFAVNLAVTGGERPSLSYDEIRKDCPEDIINLISACWDMEPSKRHSMNFVANIMAESLRNAGTLEPLKYSFRNGLIDCDGKYSFRNGLIDCDGKYSFRNLLIYCDDVEIHHYHNKIAEARRAFISDGSARCTPKTITFFKEPGRKSLGITIGMPSSKGMGMFVRTVFPTGQAADDGTLQAGDEIVEINGNSVQGMSYGERLLLLRKWREGTIVLKILGK